jgi:hypothetical protein
VKELDGAFALACLEDVLDNGFTLLLVAYGQEEFGSSSVESSSCLDT